MSEQEIARLKHALYLLEFLSKNRSPVVAAMIQEVIAILKLTLSKYDPSIMLDEQMALGFDEEKSNGIVGWLKSKVC